MTTANKNRVIATLTLDDLGNETVQNWTEHNILSEMIIKMLVARISNQVREKITKNVKGFAKPDNGGNVVESGYEVELYVFTPEELSEFVREIKDF